ncbi:MAG: hypothetical protein ACPGRG_09385 [Marinomonas sp.]|uniref:hypothetical protein n=1 Tax=Marinomonas pontica TaxID=264739 RepID=UPI0030C74EDE
MILCSSLNTPNESAQAEALVRRSVMSLTQWQQHYQAETVDLRYFFHSGWSS